MDAGLYSKLAESIVPSVEMYLEKIDFKDTTCPVVFCSDAKLISESKEIRKRVIKHVISPILWNKVLARFDDCDMLLIPTPGKDLMQKVQEYYPDKKVVLVATPQDIENLKNIFNENNQKPGAVD